MMIENWKINGSQFKILVILCFIGSSILLAPGTLSSEAKQDAWISSILGLVISLLLVWLYNSLGNLFPNMTLLEYTEKIFGKWISRIIYIFFIIFLFINCSMLLYIVGDFMITQIMPETPIQFITILFTLVIIIATRLGLETFARAGEILYPLVIILFMVLMLFLLPEVDTKRLTPLLESSPKALLKGTVLYASFSSFPLIVLLVLFPTCVNNLKEAKKSFLRGALIGSVIIVIMTFFCISVLGHNITTRTTYPTYILAKEIDLADFIQRIEAIIAIIWLITMFYKTLLYFYGSVLGLSQIFNLKDYRPITLPMGMILVILSLVVYPNSTYAATWNTTTWIPYVLTFGFVYPLILLLIGGLRKKREKRKIKS